MATFASYFETGLRGWFDFLKINPDVQKKVILRCIEKHGRKFFVSRTVLQIMIRENMNLFKNYHDEYRSP